MNAMIVTEGTPSDYDEWVRLGAKGWDYNNIKPYLRKIEGHIPHKDHPNTTHEHRGDKGRVQTGYSHCIASTLPSFTFFRLTWHPDYRKGLPSCMH